MKVVSDREMDLIRKIVESVEQMPCEPSDFLDIPRVDYEAFVSGIKDTPPHEWKVTPGDCHGAPGVWATGPEGTIFVPAMNDDADEAASFACEIVSLFNDRRSTSIIINEKLDRIKTAFSQVEGTISIAGTPGEFVPYEAAMKIVRDQKDMIA